MVLGEIDLTTSQILYYSCPILERCTCKKTLRQQYYFVDFSKVFDPIHRGKMVQIWPIAYGLFKETVTATMMLYKNTKVKVHSPDGDRDYFDIVAGVLQGDTLAPYQFIICLDYVLRIVYRFNERKRFLAGKGKKQKIPCTNNFGHGLCWWHSTSGKIHLPKLNPCYIV